MLTTLSDLWAREPARITSFLAAAIVFVCAKAGILVDAQSVGSAIAIVVPILLGGEHIRSKVVPVHHLVADPAKIPPDEISKP